MIQVGGESIIVNKFQVFIVVLDFLQKMLLYDFIKTWYDVFHD